MKIAIVGAGPAGCHLAHCLADTDHEILLFDHRVHPSHKAGYEKPCGGGLSPLVGRQFPEVMALPFARHRPPRVLLKTSDGSQVEQPLESNDWAVVSRAEFGRALLQRALANGRVRHVGQKVTRIEQTGEGWSLCTARGEMFSADFLAGADGVRSLVRRQVIGPISHQHLGLAVGYWVRGVPDAIVFQTYADQEGYLWSFPRTDHASVGICAPIGTIPPRRLWQRVEQFLDENAIAHRKACYAGLLPMARDARLWDMPCAGRGWALLGDAAGHMHPLTGEGIAYALWSAKLLAEALGEGDPMIYENLWREHYGQALIASSEMLCRAGGAQGAFEVLFQLALAMAFPGSG